MLHFLFGSFSTMCNLLSIQYDCTHYRHITTLCLSKQIEQQRQKVFEHQTAVAAYKACESASCDSSRKSSCNGSRGSSGRSNSRNNSANFSSRLSAIYNDIGTTRIVEVSESKFPKAYDEGPCSCFSFRSGSTKYPCHDCRHAAFASQRKAELAKTGHKENSPIHNTSTRKETTTKSASAIRKNTNPSSSIVEQVKKSRDPFLQSTECVVDFAVQPPSEALGPKPHESSRTGSEIESKSKKAQSKSKSKASSESKSKKKSKKKSKAKSNTTKSKSKSDAQNDVASPSSKESPVETHEEDSQNARVSFRPIQWSEEEAAATKPKTEEKKSKRKHPSYKSYIKSIGLHPLELDHELVSTPETSSLLVNFSQAFLSQSIPAVTDRSNNGHNTSPFRADNEPNAFRKDASQNATIREIPRSDQVETPVDEICAKFDADNIDYRNIQPTPSSTQGSSFFTSLTPSTTAVVSARVADKPVLVSAKPQSQTIAPTKSCSPNPSYRKRPTVTPIHKLKQATTALSPDFYAEENHQRRYGLRLNPIYLQHKTPSPAFTSKTRSSSFSPMGPNTPASNATSQTTVSRTSTPQDKLRRHGQPSPARRPFVKPIHNTPYHRRTRSVVRCSFQPPPPPSPLQRNLATRQASSPPPTALQAVRKSPRSGTHSHRSGERKSPNSAGSSSSPLSFTPSNQPTRPSPYQETEAAIETPGSHRRWSKRVAKASCETLRTDSSSDTVKSKTKTGLVSSASAALLLSSNWLRKIRLPKKKEKGDENHGPLYAQGHNPKLDVQGYTPEEDALTISAVKHTEDKKGRKSLYHVSVVAVSPMNEVVPRVSEESKAKSVPSLYREPLPPPRGDVASKTRTAHVEVKELPPTPNEDGPISASTLHPASASPLLPKSNTQAGYFPATTEPQQVLMTNNRGLENESRSSTRTPIVHRLPLSLTIPNHPVYQYQNSAQLLESPSHTILSNTPSPLSHGHHGTLMPLVPKPVLTVDTSTAIGSPSQIHAPRTSKIPQHKLQSLLDMEFSTMIDIAGDGSPRLYPTSKATTSSSSTRPSTEQSTSMVTPTTTRTPLSKDYFHYHNRDNQFHQYSPPPTYEPQTNAWFPAQDRHLPVGGRANVDVKTIANMYDRADSQLNAQAKEARYEDVYESKSKTLETSSKDRRRGLSYLHPEQTTSNEKGRRGREDSCSSATYSSSTSTSTSTNRTIRARRRQHRHHEYDALTPDTLASPTDESTPATSDTDGKYGYTQRHVRLRNRRLTEEGRRKEAGGQEVPKRRRRSQLLLNVDDGRKKSYDVSRKEGSRSGSMNHDDDITKTKNTHVLRTRAFI